MKIVLLLAAAVCAVSADDDVSVTSHRPRGVPARYASAGGYASSYGAPQYYAPRPYRYAYGVNDVHGSGAQFSHGEESDGATRRGRYRVLLPDGCTQTVTYWADHTGYHPTVQYDCTPAHAPTPAYAQPTYVKPTYAPPTYVKPTYRPAYRPAYRPTYRPAYRPSYRYAAPAPAYQPPNWQRHGLALIRQDDD